jgi:2'-5' RNA ligase
MSGVSKTPLYAMVAYVRGPVGTFVEALRAELHPEQAQLAAHITVLPPRELLGSEEEAIAGLQRLSAPFRAFEAELGEVETFMPSTPTVFIRVTKGAHRFRDMHVAFNAGVLRCNETWPYMPHLTIAKMPDEPGAQRVLNHARKKWPAYSGAKRSQVNELVFVREGEAGQWTDLAALKLKG